MFLQNLKRIVRLCLLLIGMSGLQFGFAQDYPRFEENTLYVKFKDQSPVSAKKMQVKGEMAIPTRLLGFSAKLIDRYKIMPEATPMALFDNPILDRTFMIEVNPEAKVSLEKLMEELKANPEVEYVERVPYNHIFSTPSPKTDKDPFYGRVGEKQLNTSWHLDLINAEKAWELQTGDPEIIVAVVDNAIWADHEDLDIPQDRQYNCVKKEEGNSAPPVNASIQNQSCGREALLIATCVPYNWSHGTHCAGAIAAINNNGKGIASIGSGVSLMGVGGPNTQDPSGVFNPYHGVAWAAEHGAKIISCSWGGAAYSWTNENIMKSCYDKGVIIIAAAGNDNISTLHYPAAYTPYVISVGSVDADRKKSSFSNYGNWIDILSPGGSDTSSLRAGIFSTTFCQNQYSREIHGVTEIGDAYYDEMSGTSMATPVLSGVVSLMLSKDKTLTTEQVRTILQNTGQEAVSQYFTPYCKVVDAYAALKHLDDGQRFGPKVVYDSMTIASEHDTVWLTWQAPETDETILGYKIYRNGTVIAEKTTALAYVDTNLNPGFFRYAIEPLYANLSSVRTSIDVTVKTYHPVRVFIRPDSTAGRVEGTGMYEEGSQYFLQAFPAEGYEFDYWVDETNIEVYIPRLSGEVTRSVNLFAYFKPIVGNEDLNPIGKALRISPNPASETILVQCDEYEMNMVRIYDLAGKEIFRQSMAAHELTVRIAEWPMGTYIVRVDTPNGSASKKLIKR